MIGGLILQESLEDARIAKVTVITRKPTGITHEKLVEVLHHDFSDFSPIASLFENIDITYFCLGIYTGAVDRETFRTITVEYTKVFADMLKAKSPNASFVFLSGQGADRKEKSRVMFAKDKGIAENYLLSKKFNALTVFRPGYIYPVTPRKEPNMSYVLFRKYIP